jgi:type III pantothenate kinase
MSLKVAASDSVKTHESNLRLELDVGNTRIKWRVRSRDLIISAGSDLKLDVFTLDPLPSWLGQVVDVWVSSVHQEQNQWLTQRFPSAQFARTQQVECGLKNSYADPSSMGVDRWLAMLAAWSSQPANQSGTESATQHIVIDAGTAITLDIIDESGQHVGGYICPGFNMMKSTLLGGTDKVLANNEWSVGRSPGDATQFCVDHGIQDMVSSWVERHCQSRPDAKIWVSGGDGVMLTRLLSNQYTYNSDLVLDGLIISFNNTIYK